MLICLKQNLLFQNYNILKQSVKNVCMRTIKHVVSKNVSILISYKHELRRKNYHIGKKINQVALSLMDPNHDIASVTSTFTFRTFNIHLAIATRKLET